MAEPIVFISRNRVKDGRISEFRDHYLNSLPSILESKPGTLAQLSYENDTATEVTVIRFFPDAQALDLQIQGADQRSKKTYEFIEPTSIEIFGTPSPATLEMMKKVAGSGVAVSIQPYYEGGFIR